MSEINPMKRSILMFTFLCSISLGAFAQNGNSTSSGLIEGYILFNNYPYFVTMTPQGDIKEFVRTAPEIMKGASFDYNLEPPVALGPYVKKVPAVIEYVSPLNTTVISDASGMVVKTDDEMKNEQDLEGMAESTQNKVDQVPVVKPKEVELEKLNDKTAEVTESNKAQVKDISIVEDEEPVLVETEKIDNEDTVAEGTVIKFQGFSARLTPEIILQLEDIAADYNENPNRRVIIQSFITANDPSNKRLAQNRMDACKDLLITYGVQEENMTTDLLPYRSSFPGNVLINLE